MSNLQPETSFCNNKWCQNHGSVPSTGMLYPSDRCSSLQTMILERNTTGGPTGRGVQPCPYGFYENNQKIYKSPSDTNFSKLFFQPEQPGWLPQQGEPRPFIRIGNTYRNSS